MGRTWISQFKHYRIWNAVLAKTQLTTQGPMISEPGYDIEFLRDRMLAPWEQEYARQVWPKFRGEKHYGFVSPGDPEPTVMGNIDPVLDRVSLYDLDWCPEWAKDAVVNCLENHAGNGTDYVEVQKPVLRPPWKTYDDIKVSQGRSQAWVADQILTRVNEIGLDPLEVAHYEQLQENRDYVIEALLGAVTPEEDSIEVLA